MRAGQPSQTARGAAAYRAVHQTLDRAAIFRDPFALAILDEETRAGLDAVAADPALRPMRLFVSARSRFSEDCLLASVARGVRQAVVLGAGLDTFALRNPHASVHVFEVDFPATQAWKRERLREAAIAVPASLIFAPVDFEHERLAEGLAKAGFRTDEPAFFQWLGVVPYLSREAIAETLGFIATVPAAEVVFDYAEPFENYPAERRAQIMGVAERAAARGEPWLSLFDPSAISVLLRETGFAAVEDLGLAALSDRYYGTLREGIPIGPGAHVVRALR
ncbi:SAM-dependent methyltransferase [Bradyrhizobium sp. NP1]|uniref:class I SAM-dependent methyltransferase n=1 Tax=Bradyrhizobium sp. NP1 TaxID=3049772 RepID=UPI0025A5FC17|nr:SAM-dependent methyltransferase [Bradyrhizobium sp. NP1]WJR74997.1 SAM-dependent methyltransferase [Bradyrhizobium sp. NP1]